MVTETAIRPDSGDPADYSPSSDLTESPPMSPVTKLSMPRKTLLSFARPVYGKIIDYSPSPSEDTGTESPPTSPAPKQLSMPRRKRKEIPTGETSPVHIKVPTPLKFHVARAAAITPVPIKLPTPAKPHVAPAAPMAPIPIGDFGDFKQNVQIVDGGPQLAQVLHVPAQMPQLAPDVQAPRIRRPAFRPQSSGSFDVGNAGMFHVKWLQKGGRRADVPIAGGVVHIRPKSVTIDVHTFTFATRTDLTPFFVGLFPLGGHIDGKNISSARLLRYVFSKLPGSVTISY